VNVVATYAENNFTTAVSFADATAFANSQMSAANSAVDYVLLQNVTIGAGTTSVLFVDTNGDNVADTSVILTGVTTATFDAANIVA